MKKRNLLIFVLAVVMVAMGAGYAAWTQDFTVTANVDTGKLSVIVGDFGKDTEVNTVRIMGPEGEVYHEHLMNSSAVEGDEVKGWTLTPSNGSALEYLAVEMYTPGNKEYLDVNLSTAYPGLEVEMDVEVLNDGTVPVVIETDAPAVFKGAGDNASFAQYLLDEGYVEFVIVPNNADGPNGYQIKPEFALPLNVTMKINSSLPNTVVIGGEEINVEEQSLSYQMLLVANQDV